MSEISRNQSDKVSDEFGVAARHLNVHFDPQEDFDQLATTGGGGTAYGKLNLTRIQEIFNGKDYEDG